MRIALIISLLCVLSSVSYGQPSTTTVDAIDRMVRSLTDTLIAYHQGEKLSYTIVAHPDAEWIGGIIGRRCEERGKAARRTEIGVVADVVISVSDVSTRYQLMENNDSVRRVIAVKLDARDGRSGQVLLLPSMQREDAMLREFAASSESMQHSGTHGDIPPPPTSFWDDVAQPAIFIAAAATTVILLFTVRSQ